MTKTDAMPLSGEDAELERVTMRKVAARLIPFMFLLYIFAILDRSNVGTAVLTMKQDLKFSASVYGFGAGIFFVGYFLFEVPSNIIMERVGARRWIARIMFTWGIIAAAMMLTRSPMSFYILRFLLGVAEAGFFPGMILYLTYWFPNNIRGRAGSAFIVAGTVAGIVGGPLGALLLKMNGIGGLQGWQWLYLMEGIPSFFLGFVVLFYMTDKPEKAHWLEDAERAWLLKTLAREQTHRQKYHHMSIGQALRYPRVLHLCALFFIIIFSGAGLGFFQQLLLQQRSTWSNTFILNIGVIPALINGITLLAVAIHSDRTRERRWYVVIGTIICAAGVAMVAETRSPVWTMVGLCIVAIGGAAWTGPFWALTTGFLSGAAAAGGIAFINSVGNMGSFFSPILMGKLKDATHNYELGLFLLAGSYIVAAIVAFRLPLDPALHVELAEAVAGVEAATEEAATNKRE